MQQRQDRTRRKNSSKKTAGPVTLPRQSRCPSAAAGCNRHCCATGDPSASGTATGTGPELWGPTSNCCVGSREFPHVTDAGTGAALRNRRGNRRRGRAPRPEGRPIGVGRRSPSNYFKDENYPAGMPALKSSDQFSDRHPICRVRRRKSTPRPSPSLSLFTPSRFIRGMHPTMCSLLC